MLLRKGWAGDARLGFAVAQLGVAEKDEEEGENGSLRIHQG